MPETLHINENNDNEFNKQLITDSGLLTNKTEILKKYFNKATIFVYTLMSVELIWVVIIFIYCSDHTFFNKTTCYIQNTVGCLTMVGMILYYIFVLKDKKQKQFFFKFCSLLAMINQVPMLYMVFFRPMFYDGQYSMLGVASWLAAPKLCNIVAWVGVYLGFAKNKRNFIYGAVAMFVVYCGIIGAGLSTLGYAYFGDHFFHTHPNMIMYVYFSMCWAHFPLVVLSVLIIKEKLTKFSFVNSFYFLLILALCYVKGVIDVTFFYDRREFPDAILPFGTNSMYITEDIFENPKGILKFPMLMLIFFGISILVSLYFEFFKFPKELRFYKKFNIFNTYYKNNSANSLIF